MPISLTRLALRRPIGTTALCLLVIGLSAAAFVRLPVALLPELQYPSLAVWTAVPDVTPERVERLVTEPLEKALSGSPGLDGMTSRSQLGGSLIRLDFDWSTNIDLALFSVREELDRRSAILPQAAQRPVILRLDPSARPILWITARPDLPAKAKASAAPLSSLSREIFARRLEQIPGVARVLVSGSLDQRVEIRVDPNRLAGYGITLGQIEGAVQGANISLVGGQVHTGPLVRLLEISGEYRGVDDIGSTVVSHGEQGLIRLRDLATIREQWEPRRGQVRLDGSEVLLLLVERRPESNTVTTARAVRSALSELEEQFPSVDLDVVVDESVFIRDAIQGVVTAAGFGGVLAILILMFFVRRLGPLMALILAIPLSLALTLIFFDLLDITFNLVSLGGLALGIGLLVDNAIVVVENIARQRELGLPPRRAGEVGTRQVAMAITASTLTTIAVFGPLVFVEGLAGRLFRDQSLAVVCSLAASLLVAVTVVPLVATRLESQVFRPSRRRRLRLRATYEGLLALCLRRPVVSALVLAVFLAAVSALGVLLPRETLPRTEQARLMLRVELPGSTHFEAFSEAAAALERELAALPGVTRVLADLGERNQAQLEFDPRTSSQGDLVVTLDSRASQAAVSARIRGLLARSPLEGSVRAVRTRLEELISPVDQDLFLDLLGPRREDSEVAAGTLFPTLRESPALVNVSRLRGGLTPVYRLAVDRIAAARLELPIDDLTAQMEAAARGWQISELRTVNQDIPIVVRAPDRSSLDTFLSQPILTNQGQYPLSTFVRLQRDEAASSLLRQDQRPVVRLAADIAPSHDLSQAVSAARAAASSLPPGVRLQVRGVNETFLEGLRAMGLSLLLSGGLVYLILAAQFESLLQPLIILAAVPLAAGGAVLSLAVTGESLNLMSLTGCVVLVGIVVNDAIIKVDFINQERRRGSSLDSALKEAGKARFRPIMMTTTTTVLALLPLCFGLGSGSELQTPLAITLVGGLSSATALTLFAVPVLYLLVDGLKSQAPTPP